MKCPNCGYDNPDVMTFCGKCGEALKKVCPACNFMNPPDFDMCGNCGKVLTSLDAEAALLEQAKGTVMECPQCKAENPDGMRFCGQCGAMLVSDDVTLYVVSNSGRLWASGLMDTLEAAVLLPGNSIIVPSCL
jgi:predicted amidophosphoribosyltransferase